MVDNLVFSTVSSDQGIIVGFAYQIKEKKNVLIVRQYLETQPNSNEYIYYEDLADQVYVLADVCSRVEHSNFLCIILASTKSIIRRWEITGEKLCVTNKINYIQSNSHECKSSSIISSIALDNLGQRSVTCEGEKLVVVRSEQLRRIRIFERNNIHQNEQNKKKKISNVVKAIFLDSQVLALYECGHVVCWNVMNNSIVFSSTEDENSMSGRSSVTFVGILTVPYSSHSTWITATKDGTLRLMKVCADQ